MEIHPYNSLHQLWMLTEEGRVSINHGFKNLIIITATAIIMDSSSYLEAQGQIIWWISAML